jgi:hypothetical protein
MVRCTSFQVVQIISYCMNIHHMHTSYQGHPEFLLNRKRYSVSELHGIDILGYTTVLIVTSLSMAGITQCMRAGQPTILMSFVRRNCIQENSMRRICQFCCLQKWSQAGFDKRLPPLPEVLYCRFYTVPIPSLQQPAVSDHQVVRRWNIPPPE